jgi:hypothetical protein
MGHVLFFIIGICIFIELTFGFETNPNRKLYNYLFKPNVFFICLFICLLIAVVGFRSYNGTDSKVQIGFLIPLHYVLVFKLVDSVSERVNGRHIIISARGDNRPSEYSWLDTLLSVILLFTSVILPMLEVLFLLPKTNYA